MRGDDQLILLDDLLNILSDDGQACESNIESKIYDPFLAKTSHEYQSWDPRLSERFSPERERLTWEGEVLGYIGDSRLSENCLA
ncbi:hypothetical protein Lal_00032978 [Lupinus albus]|nr:hypothetical protein Lal_00032978 [Lupinus albus]